MSRYTVKLDRAAELRLLARFTPQQIARLLRHADEEGARAALTVMSSQAPVGTASRPSQYYRKRGYGHGTLQRSVAVSRARQRGNTVAVVIGPQGPQAFARFFVAKRNPWVERTAKAAFTVARRVSGRLLEAYARG